MVKKNGGKMATRMVAVLSIILTISEIEIARGCQFYPAGEYLRFARIPENLAVDSEVMQIEVHPRKDLTLQPIDKDHDVEFFKIRSVNRSMVSIRLAHSLEDLVDGPIPQSVLKFRMVCDYDEGEDTASSYLSVSVYVEDINDHAPVFHQAPYFVKVDEITSPGTTIFSGIFAKDGDKPNTPNSDVHYSIVGGNERGKFSLEDANPAALLVRSPLDYDNGDRNFALTILASDRGIPQRSATAVLTVAVTDNDDLGPKFSREKYKTQIPEFHPITGRRVHQELKFYPPIQAADQDGGINVSLRYDLVVPAEAHGLFSVDNRSGAVFLDKEIDSDTMSQNSFILQLQAFQTDNSLKWDTAKLEVDILDLNDNFPQFEVDVYNISIVENLPHGFSVLQALATDRDRGENADFTYQLVDPSQAFSIDKKTGWISVKDEAKLDREVKPKLSMRVYAREKMPSVLASVGEHSDPFATVDVTLLDANDNNPSFVPNNMYEFTVKRDVPPGHVIGNVQALDPDYGSNGQVIYSIQRGANSSQNEEYFAVHPKEGVVVARESLTVGRHTIFVEAADQPANPSEKRFALAVVTIHVISDQKHYPEFVGAPYEFWVGSDAPIGTSIGQIRAEGDTEEILYDLLHSYHEGVPFAVEEKSGIISVVDAMSKYDRVGYNFEAVAANTKGTTLNTNVTIHVVESDASAVATRSNEPVALSFRVKENVAGATVGQLIKRSANSRRMNRTEGVRQLQPQQQRFVIVGPAEMQSKFVVSQDGTLYTQLPLDREQTSNYQLTIFAESGKRVIRNLFHVNVTVDDENDNAPVFDRPRYEGKINENSPGGTELKLENGLRVTDADTSVNAAFHVFLVGDGSEKFIVDQKTLKIYSKEEALLDRETRAEYHLKLLARDRGNLTSESRLQIAVNDVNDHAPKFVQMVVHHKEGVEIANRNKTRVNDKNQNVDRVKELITIIVPETLKIGTAVIRLRATDDDENENVAYGILSETFIPKNGIVMKTYTTHHFNIHPITGETSVSNALPPETDFILNVTATDKGGMQGHTAVKVHIRDENNNAPQFPKSWYDFSLSEGSYNGHILSYIRATDEDYGANGNVTYAVVQKREPLVELPFRISHEGALLVHGELDRERQEFYSFRIVAEDQGEKSLRSTVDVDVRVSDLNDNYPAFYNYDKMVQLRSDSNDISTRRGPIPVYYATVPENAGSGIPIARVFANDSDLPANGNGMVLFHLPRRRNQRELFAIDSKDGVISTLVSLDYEEESVHNVTVLASDLGKPSLTSTALVVIDVGDTQETTDELSSPIFAHRYYEMEVEENCAVPLSLLALNVSTEYNNKRFGSLHFTMVSDEQSSFFKVNPQNGSIYLVRSPDREITPVLKAKIRVERVSKRGKSVQMIYPLQSDIVADLGPNEVKLIIHVLDENDNAPKFVTNGRPVVAVVPNSATYGHPVMRIRAVDADMGVNADIRYDILPRTGEDEETRFNVDPVTGQIRAASSFIFDVDRVFGFDVKATDRAGSPDGKSTICNVFVFVTSDISKVVLMLDGKPEDVEQNINNVTQVLTEASGLDVRIRKLEPHFDKDGQTVVATKLYLYAVDTMMNSIIDNDFLSRSLKEKELDLSLGLEPFKVLAITSFGENEIRTHRSSTEQNKSFISGLEAMGIVLGCVIFLGAFTAAVCVACFNRKRTQYKKSKKLFPTVDPIDIPFSMYTGTKSMTQLSTCTPRSLFNPLSFVEDSTDSYTDADFHRHQQRRMSYSHRQQQPHHGKCNGRSAADKCAKSNNPLMKGNRPQGLMRGMLGSSSMLSLHSSGRDSGIDPHNRTRSGGSKCHCKHVFSSGCSNDSYEDSLKSLQQQQISSSSDSETKKPSTPFPRAHRNYSTSIDRQHHARRSTRMN